MQKCVPDVQIKLKAGGKPSTWFPPGGLVEQEEMILNWACPIGCNLIRFLPIL